VEGSCEHGNEPSGSIKYWEILHNWRLLKKGSSPWDWLDVPSPVNVESVIPTDWRISTLISHGWGEILERVSWQQHNKTCTALD
jgi:hypothetical protein